MLKLVSSGGSLRDTAIGDDRATAYLDEFGYGDTLTFTIDNREAQPGLGIANFTIRIRWKRGDDSCKVVEGVERTGGSRTPRRAGRRSLLGPVDC